VYSNIIIDTEAYTGYTGGPLPSNAIPFSLTPFTDINYYFNSGQGVTGVETGVFEITSAGTYRINACINYTYTDVFTGSSAYGLRAFGNTLTGFYGTGSLYPIGAPYFFLRAGIRGLIRYQPINSTVTFGGAVQINPLYAASVDFDTNLDLSEGSLIYITFRPGTWYDGTLDAIAPNYGQQLIYQGSTLVIDRIG